MDPLSDILSLLKPRTAISAGLKAGGAWAIRFPSHEGVKFNAVLRGACWVEVEGEAAQRIEAGDCFLLTRGRRFTFATEPGLQPYDSAAIYERARDGIAVCQGGDDFFLIGGRFTFEGDHAGMLFGALPPLVKVSWATSEAAILRWTLEQLAVELRERPPGEGLMAEHLAQIMLLQILRLHAANGAAAPGWLRALGDTQIARTLQAMHAEPARRWTLLELARLAGMSRTTFAERFRRTVGEPPLSYLTRWRMWLAADRLRHSNEPVAAIAYAAGYAAEAAFSTTFRRVMGCAPGRYRRGIPRT